MSLVEGGEFICYKDGFRTANKDEWNEHCSQPEGDSTHITEQGSTVCITCGIGIEFTDLPFHPYKADGSKGIALKCEECENKTIGNVKRKSVGI
jgi:hypothetical protein